MTKKIAVVDPYMVTPALSAYNRMVDLLGVPLHYHQPRVAPGTLETARADAYLVLGSASHVTEALEWHSPLADFLLAELRRGKPVLGICFGHQLICHALGGEVRFLHADERKLTGARTVELTRELAGLPSGERLSLAVRHRQAVVKLPEELVEVGRGVDPALPHDLVAHREWPFLGCQPHPEEFPAEGVLPVDGDRLIKGFFRSHGVVA